MTEEIKQAAKQLKSIVGLGMSLDECESFMGSCMQSYHTAKLEEVEGSAEYWKAEHDAQVHKCNKFQMEISTLKAEIEYAKENHALCAKQCEHKNKLILDVCEERDKLKAEIANLKEANIEYRGEVERLKEKAQKWDALGEKISTHYDNANSDLTNIGEDAATAFGYL